MNDSLHDHLFRSIFGMPERAAAELRSVLPAAITDEIDWPTLAPTSASSSTTSLRAATRRSAVGREALMAVLRYLSRVKDAREPELFTESRLPMVAPEVRAMGMTAADRWIEQGLQKGLQQGLQQGRQEGQVDTQRAVLRRLLSKRFGAIAPDIERRIAAAASPDLGTWIERVLDAATIDAVFAS